MEQPPRPDLPPAPTLADLADRSRDELAARVIELETLCTDVLMVSVDAGLPQPLLNRLWAAVGRGTDQHAFRVELPPKAQVPMASAPPPVPLPVAPTPPPVAEPMHIPDIRLSSSPARTAGDGTPASELKPLPSRKTVLVVDDDPMMLNVLGRILERENFELLMASGGPEALKALDDHGAPVDLLVTDYAMPGMQGRELAERVRERFPKIRVLYQTGFSDLLFDNCVELEDGAAFLEKPFTARGLREAARLVLFGTLNPA